MEITETWGHVCLLDTWIEMETRGCVTGDRAEHILKLSFLPGVNNCIQLTNIHNANLNL